MTRTNPPTAFSNTTPTTTVSLPATALPLPTTFTDNRPLPQLIVFDLDFTLWPLWCDTHVSTPIKANPKDSYRSVKDSSGDTHGFYNDVAPLLASLKEKGIKVGVASRTHTPDIARKMLSLIRLPVQATDGDGRGSADDAEQGKPAISAFDYLEMYPGSKTAHFRKIQKASRVPFEEMLFFDDESRNRNVEDLGVTMRLVRDGVTRAEIDKGVEEWRERNKKRLEGTGRED